MKAFWIFLIVIVILTICGCKTIPRYGYKVDGAAMKLEYERQISSSPNDK